MVCRPPVASPALHGLGGPQKPSGRSSEGPAATGAAVGLLLAIGANPAAVAQLRRRRSLWGAAQNRARKGDGGAPSPLRHRSPVAALEPLHHRGRRRWPVQRLLAAENKCRLYLRQSLFQSHYWRVLRGVKRNRRRSGPSAAAGRPQVSEEWERRRKRLLAPLRRAEAQIRAESPFWVSDEDVRKRCARVFRRVEIRRRRLLLRRRRGEQRAPYRSHRRLLKLRRGIPLADKSAQRLHLSQRRLGRLLKGLRAGLRPEAEDPLVGDILHPTAEPPLFQVVRTPDLFNLFTTPSRHLPFHMRPDYQELKTLGQQLRRSLWSLRREMKRDPNRNFFRPRDREADGRDLFPGIYDDTRRPPNTPWLYRSNGVSLCSPELRRRQWLQREENRRPGAKEGPKSSAVEGGNSGGSKAVHGHRSSRPRSHRQGGDRRESGGTGEPGKPREPFGAPFGGRRKGQRVPKGSEGIGDPSGVRRRAMGKKAAPKEAKEEARLSQWRNRRKPLAPSTPLPARPPTLPPTPPTPPIPPSPLPHPSHPLRPQRWGQGDPFLTFFGPLPTGA